MVAETKRPSSGIGPLAYTVIALIVLGTAGFWILQIVSKNQPQSLQLSPEAKQYVRNLTLTGVELRAADSYLNQTIVEIDGKITNGGDRALDTVEVYCVFYDAYGQVVLRQRVPIVTNKLGVLRPSEWRNFRLPFDNLPGSWNHQLPQLVIAGIKFA